ncbi:MAG TPA: M20/M25/M40 family metallo-hydrolase [Bacteroidia bacterium]|nr:M20/M25/M40 family metallo-hydrolase [Bacteroidia bacterium]
MNPASCFASAERHIPEALDFLRDLVSVNSFTANADGVAEVARITAERFAPLGFSADFVPCAVPNTGPHLFLDRPGPGDPTLLATHSDTVFPAIEEAANQFRWDERPDEGRIYGPGTIDNKGCTALLWLMLQVLRDCAPERLDSARWLVAANAAEEITGDDFGIAATRVCGGKARAVLVFEGGPVDERGWHLVTSRKGRSTWRLDAEGKAAHAGSQHHLGINAIDALATALPGISALTDPGENRTVNLGAIYGGTVVNRVPHEASAEWECRAASPDSLARADAAFAALSGLAPNGAVLTATRTGFTRPWPGGPETDRLYSLWEQAAVSIGLTTVSAPRGGLSDANHLAHLGPVLDGLGPSGGNAHCSERRDDGSKLPEYLEPASMVPKAVMNALAIGRL